MGEGNVAVMSLPPMRGHEGLLPLQRRLCRPRSLFGRADPLYLKEAVSQISQENKLRWNFDFENEKPMPGRYKWQSVDDADSNGGSEQEENSPENGVKNAPENDLAIASKSDLENAIIDPASIAKDAENDSKNSSAKDVEGVHKKEQTRITDFMRKRKSSNQKERTTAVPQRKTPRRSST